MAVTIDSIIRWWGIEESDRTALSQNGDRDSAPADNIGS